MSVRPAPDYAKVFVERNEVGMIGWFMNGNGLSVFGDAATVAPIAVAVAEKLNGQFVQD